MPTFLSNQWDAFMKSYITTQINNTHPYRNMIEGLNWQLAGQLTGLSGGIARPVAPVVNSIKSFFFSIALFLVGDNPSALLNSLHHPPSIIKPCREHLSADVW